MYEEYFANRRLDSRKACSWKGRCVSRDGVKHAVNCEDVSARGLGIASQVPMPPRMQTTIEVNTEKAGILTLQGQVCWCKKDAATWRAGVIFNRRLSLDLKKVV